MRWLPNRLRPRSLEWRAHPPTSVPNGDRRRLCDLLNADTLDDLVRVACDETAATSGVERLFVVGYPPDQTQPVQDVVAKFHSRRLVVPLYLYNRVLNTLRDRLKQGEGCHAP